MTDDICPASRDVLEIMEPIDVEERGNGKFELKRLYALSAKVPLL